MNTSERPSERGYRAGLGLALALSTINNLPAVRGQFFGEDESNQLRATLEMLEALGRFDPVRLFGLVAFQHHPPLRYFLAMPGALLFPQRELGVRLIAIVLSFVMTVEVGRLGRLVGGPRVGVAAALWIAASGVYSWTSMAFGWSLIVILYAQAVRALWTGSLDLGEPSGRRTHVRVQSCVALAFLVNTGNLLFFAATCLVLLLANRRRPRVVIAPFAMAGSFYALYYFAFLVLAPWAAARFGATREPFGQLLQNLSRAGALRLNVESFVHNLQGLNGYFLPYLSWAVLLLALLQLYRRRSPVLIWVGPFLFGWSFLLTGNSQQYFLLVFIVLVPFAVRAIAEWLGERGLLLATALMVPLLLAWSVPVLVLERGDGEQARVEGWIARGFARIERQHNVKRPYAALGRDLDRVLGGDDRFVHDLSGSFTAFYYTDRRAAHLAHSRWVGAPGSPPFALQQEAGCERAEGWPEPRPRAVVSERALCLPGVERIERYPGSRVRLYVLSRGAAAH